MQPDQIKKIHQEGGVVYKWEQTQIEVLPMKQVEAYVQQIWEKKKTLSNESDVEEALLKDADEGLKRFATKTHKTIFSILTSPSATEKDYRNMLMMIEAKRRIANGEDELETINALHRRFE